jgi:hypothetical protein
MRATEHTGRVVLKQFDITCSLVSPEVYYLYIQKTGDPISKIRRVRTLDFVYKFVEENKTYTFVFVDRRRWYWPFSHYTIIEGVRE